MIATKQHYDLIVLGSGPAGEKAAAQAAYFDKRVAVIEGETEPGGAGVNTGTLPSKTLREAALYLSGAKSRGLHGVNLLVKKDISAQDFMYREKYVVARQHERIKRNLDRHRIDYINGWGSFVDTHTVAVQSKQGERRLSADIILIATGSTPVRPAIAPKNDPAVHDSDSILKLDKLPRSLCVVGGGVIGCEYATMFAAMGIRVILVDGRPRLLEFIDGELSERLRQHMHKLGIQVLLESSAAHVGRKSPQALTVTLADGENFEVENVLYAAGRQANTAKLNLAAVGILADKRGKLSVNEHYQTSVPHIYAAGDVIGFPALASTSMEQGRIAMCHAFGLTYKQALAHEIPYGIYTVPAISLVGETEETCKQKGLAYTVGRASYADNARAQIVGDEEGLVKLIFAPENLKLLGAHIIGERATELIHIASAVMHYGGSIDFFIQAVFNHPTLSEVFKYAAYDGLGRLTREVQARGVNKHSS